MPIVFSAKKSCCINAWISQIFPPNISGNSQYDGKKAMTNRTPAGKVEFPETLYSSGFQTIEKWFIFFLACQLAI
jgi:hypothetical protein